MANNSINRKISAVLESMGGFISEESKENLRLLSKLPHFDCNKYINHMKEILEEQCVEALKLTADEYRLTTYENKDGISLNDLDYTKEFNIALDLVAGRGNMSINEEIDHYGEKYFFHHTLQVNLSWAIKRTIERINDTEFIKLTPDMIFVLDQVINASTNRIKNINR